jgi:hypothetical protein
LIPTGDEKRKIAYGKAPGTLNPHFAKNEWGFNFEF